MKRVSLSVRVVVCVMAAGLSVSTVAGQDAPRDGRDGRDGMKLAAKRVVVPTPRAPKKPVVMKVTWRNVPRFVPTPAPTPVPAPVSKPVSKPAHYSPGSVQDRIVAAWPGDDRKALSVVRCETGGTFNPAIVSKSGKYHGLYQFDAQTYASVGGNWPASKDSVEEQTKRAWMLYQRRGWQPWSCA